MGVVKEGGAGIVVNDRRKVPLSTLGGLVGWRGLLFLLILLGKIVC